jgi:hypothetical protein
MKKATGLPQSLQLAAIPEFCLTLWDMPGRYPSLTSEDFISYSNILFSLLSLLATISNGSPKIEPSAHEKFQ